jgi:L-fucose isomerase-like protein
MPAYPIPKLERPKKPARKTATLIASGDHRLAANATCWAAQRALEAQAREALAALGWGVERAGGEDYGQGHGFIDSQAKGREIFAQIHPEAPLVVAEAVWQYSAQVLPGLCRHRGPILLLANWSGQWPGLVGVLNLRGSLTKAGVEYSMLWGEDFAAPAFREKLGQWIHKGRIKHDLSHAHKLDPDDLPKRERQLGEALASQLRERPAIMGVFDEGCMGMFNAIIPDRLLHDCGVFKERLSQSQLYAAMQHVSDEEADEVRRWLDERGMRFVTGPDPKSDLTDYQIREQCMMYIAALRFADRYGLDAIGIQYQLGLTELCAASDLAEGLLNCSDRPPVRAAEGPNEGQVIADGRPLTHFNEVDECAGLDGLITQRVWAAMGLEPDNTLHDLRWGAPWHGHPAHAAAESEGRSDHRSAGDDGRGRARQEHRLEDDATDTFVWVFEISGAVPPSHLEGGYAGAVSERQPPMYFHKGGGTIKGVSKPGEVVWSRIYVDRDKKGHERLSMDVGRSKAVSLPREETQRRWQATTPQWPIMHAVLYGVDRDQMMAKHQSNHIQVVYAPDPATADRALAAKAAMADAMGIKVNLCGSDADGVPLGEAVGRLGGRTVSR